MAFDRAFHERILGGPLTEIGRDVAVRMCRDANGRRELYWEHPCTDAPQNIDIVRL